MCLALPSPAYPWLGSGATCFGCFLREGGKHTYTRLELYVKAVDCVAPASHRCVQGVTDNLSQIAVMQMWRGIWWAVRCVRLETTPAWELYSIKRHGKSLFFFIVGGAALIPSRPNSLNPYQQLPTHPSIPQHELFIDYYSTPAAPQLHFFTRQPHFTSWLHFPSLPSLIPPSFLLSLLYPLPIFSPTSSRLCFPLSSHLRFLPPSSHLCLKPPLLS